MNVIGDSVRQRLAELDFELPGLEVALITLQANVKEMRAERRGLQRVVRQLERPADRKPAVSDEQVLEAVRYLVNYSGIIPKSAEIAEKLGVQPRNVARKLRKLVDNGKLIGDTTNGFTPVSA